MAEDLLALEYQPIVQVTDERIVAAEALLRWHDDKYGPIPPAWLVAAAERLDLIHDLGRWVLRSAAAQSAAWSAVGLDVKVTVNVASAQLVPGFDEEASALLERSGADPTDVVLEVTERGVASASSSDVLVGLRRAGLRIAIDDFGTGESSLARLSDLPVDIIKLDRRFLRSVGSNRRAAALATAAVRLGDAVGADVVAEGVERPSQLAFLQQIGCRFAQGYHLHRPAPAHVITATLFLEDMKRDLPAAAS